MKEYLKKKGEDLATKENVRELTDRIESVRHRYLSQLEELKAVIQSQLFIQQVRYKNEFKILFDLSKKTVALRDSALALRPATEYIDPKESPEERKERKLKAYVEAGKACYEVYEPAQPFYPSIIYQAVLELDRASFKEAIGYRHEKSVDTKYWDQAEKNSENIVNCTNKLLAAIRTRVREWESIISNEKS